MASVEKFEMAAVVNQLRHNNREIQNSANEDIDLQRTPQNYSMLPAREVSDYDYFLQRKSELYCYDRADVKVLAGWVVTAPADFASRPPEETRQFFETVHSFMAERYGEKNIVQSVVHMDEAGKVPHCHIVFIPVAPDRKSNHPQEEKVCAAEVLSRAELRNFHPALQKYMDDYGPANTRVYTGATAAAGGNRTVAELKRDRPIDRNREEIVSLQREVKELREELAEIKREISRNREDPGDPRSSRSPDRTIKIKI